MPQAWMTWNAQDPRLSIQKHAKGIAKIIPRNGTKRNSTMLTSRQIIHQIFSFFTINKTQAMSVTDLFNIEMRHDNLKVFNQPWEETQLLLDKNVDEELLENLYERQLRKSSLMKNALSLYHSDILLKREPMNSKKLRAVETDILEDQRQKTNDLSVGTLSR